MHGAKSTAGPERYVLALALLVPLALMGMAVSQLLGFSFVQRSTPAYADSSSRLVVNRPAPSGPIAPPTLAPGPTPVPPTAMPSSDATPTATMPATYTVRPGDELKNIAAQYGVSIWKIVDANTIADPDSLLVGQVLRIPDE